jgi:heme/copper-type cytochrome/quinol oxidase subunit 2
MSWLENLQKKSHAEKVRIIWLMVAIVSIFLVVVWIFTSNISRYKQKDTTLFQTIGRGVKDFGNNFRK